MINVCIADNFPVVHFGIKSYFKDHSDISIVSNIGNFSMIQDALKAKKLMY
jgi:DNA-binding NarL/FixJ family response regulator